jgi:Holliday junction resolvase RusA-like endonuclease
MLDRRHEAHRARHAALLDAQLDMRSLGRTSPIAPARMTAQRWSFSVVGLPISQGSAVAFTSASTGKAMLKPSNAAALSQWRHDIGEAAQRAGVPCTDGPAELVATFSFARPKSHHGKRGLRPSAPAQHIQRPDIDKLARALLDALTSIAYTDDRHVTTLTLHKQWSDAPGCVVHVLAEAPAQAAT